MLDFVPLVNRPPFLLHALPSFLGMVTVDKHLALLYDDRILQLESPLWIHWDVVNFLQDFKTLHVDHLSKARVGLIVEVVPISLPPGTMYHRVVDLVDVEVRAGRTACHADGILYMGIVLAVLLVGDLVEAVVVEVRVVGLALKVLAVVLRPALLNESRVVLVVVRRTKLDDVVRILRDVASLPQAVVYLLQKQVDRVGHHVKRSQVNDEFGLGHWPSRRVGVVRGRCLGVFDGQLDFVWA
mmetsp:Transcript_3703/g.8321  ORF Transcript_3703/g.8321 Transcript_3703/m.8321 type:complete len:241 (-) Transcript_3703:813-1535(-)